MKYLYTYNNHKTNTVTPIEANSITDADKLYEEMNKGIILNKASYIGVTIQPLAALGALIQLAFDAGYAAGNESGFDAGINQSNDCYKERKNTMIDLTYDAYNKLPTARLIKMLKDVSPAVLGGST